MEKYTPTPWQQIDGGYIRDAERQPICRLFSDTYFKNHSANAELIVKAVNAHEALMLFLREVHELSRYKSDHDLILYDFKEINKKSIELLKHLESNPLKN